jgi:hypothetical protein
MDVRRIVTGHDDSGKAIVVSDGPTPNVLKPDNRPGVEIHNLWVLDESPARVHGPEESVDRQIGLLPPKNGSVFRVIKFPPEKDWIDNVDREAAKKSFASIGAEGASDQGEPPHPLMHKTETVDYAICLQGEIYLVLDDSEVLMKAGDTCIQRGTNHAWSNRSDTDCHMMFSLVDGTFD